MKLSSKLIAKILVLCGISLTCTACYSAPYADFQIKGIVTDEAGTPIEGIKVSVPREYGLSGMTTGTGEYHLHDPYSSGCIGKVEIMAEDIDGDANGGDFATGTVSIEIENSDYTGGKGSFNMGKLRKIVDFRLKLKPGEELENNEND